MTFDSLAYDPVPDPIENTLDELKILVEAIQGAQGSLYYNDLNDKPKINVHLER